MRNAGIAAPDLRGRETLQEERVRAATSVGTGARAESSGLSDSPMAGLVSQILDVGVGTKPWVVCEIPAVVVGVLVDYDLMA